MLDEPLISLTKATDLPILRRNGRKPHFASIYRWATVGCSGIKLETVRMPSGLCTSEAAVLRFIQRLNDLPVAESPSREASVNQAEKRLAAAGIK